MPKNQPRSRSRRGSWMKCRAVAEDRNRIVRAVIEVGHALPLFTTRAVEEHLKQPKFGGLQKGELGRHLEALNGEVIIHVDADELRSPVGSSYRVWALRERRHELARHLQGFGPVTDAERVFFAVHVAVKVLETTDVATREVTNVLKCVPHLQLDFAQHTATLLNGLAGRSEPVVEKVRVEGERWVRWRPLTPARHPRLSQWVDTFARQVKANGTPGAVGHAAYSEVAREIVLIAVNASTHPTYPHGRPVGIREVQEKAKASARGRHLLESLREGDIDLYKLLGDVTRKRIAGEKRVSPRVIRLHGPLSGRTYYDIPDAEESEVRKALPQLWDLRDAAREAKIEAILEDAHHAQSLQRHYQPDRGGLTAIIATRRFLAGMELDHLAHALGLLARKNPLWSSQLRDMMAEAQARLRRGLRRLPDLSSLEEEAREALAPIGLGLDEVAAADRPRVLPSAWEGWFTAAEMKGRTPSQHLANAVSLRRFRNPDFESHDAGPEEARCTTFVDRVDALPLAATYTMAALHQELHAASRLLGRNLRHPGVVIPLLEHAHPLVRRDAFFALVLLDDPAAHDWVALRLGDRNAPPDEVIWALHAAVSLGIFEPRALPGWLHSPVHPRVTDAVQSVVRAHAHGALSR